MMKRMTRRVLAPAAVAVAASLGAAGAVAADHAAGVTLVPQEAVGLWTLASQGRGVCRLRLSGRKAAGGYAARATGHCAALPAGPLAWRPSPGGMTLMSSAGPLRFERWSNSLLVAAPGTGGHLQLRRGTDHPDAY